MAKASALAVGMKVTIRSGDYEGHQATVLDPKPIPDGGDDRAGSDQQRKVLVSIDDVFTEGGSTFDAFILPRLLDMTTGPINVGHEMAQAALVVVRDDYVVPEPTTDPMDPSLDRYRPDPVIVKRYISRMLPGGYKDIDILLAMRDQRDEDGYSPNIALVGETQSGKTMLVRVLAVLAAERDGMPKPYPIFTLNGSSGVTNYDIFGQTTAVMRNGKEFLVWMDGLVATAARVGGFLYLDEWNAVSPGQAVALHPLLDFTRRFTNTQKAVSDGHGGYMPEEVKVNKNLWVLSTINPGYKGTQTMAEATSNRFQWISWDYDDDTERRLIPSKTIRTMGAMLRVAGHDRAITVPVGTSALQRFNANCVTFGVDWAIDSFVAIFPPNERTRAMAILEDSGNVDFLRQEYPNPTFTAVPEEATPPLNRSWSDNALAAANNR